MHVLGGDRLVIGRVRADENEQIAADPVVYEQVVEATPSVALSATVLGEWQMRAALSMLFVPIARTAFWAA